MRKIFISQKQIDVDHCANPIITNCTYLSSLLTKKQKNLYAKPV